MITLKDLTNKTWCATQIIIYDDSKKSSDFVPIERFKKSDCALYVGELYCAQAVNYKHLLYRYVKNIGVIDNYLIVGI